jgi:hypothetical protein
MPFETRIHQLSDQLLKCQDDATALKLAQELQEVLHERIEQLRTKATGITLLKNPGAKSL